MTLDYNGVIPLYYQLREIIRNNIITGEWSEGTEIPSERELCEFYNVSRSTVQQALGGLVQEGLLVRQKGKGTFVKHKKIKNELLKEPSFYKQVIQQGQKASSIILDKEYQNCNKKIAGILGLNTSDKVCLIKRLRLVNDEPFILESNYISPKWDCNILSHDLETIAIYDFIEKNNGIKLTNFKTSIQPLILDKYERELFGIDEAFPGLLIESVSYCNNIPIMFNSRIFRGDQCNIYLEHSIEDGNEKLISSGVTIDQMNSK